MAARAICGSIHSSIRLSASLEGKIEVSVVAGDGEVLTIEATVPSISYTSSYMSNQSPAFLSPEQK